MVVLNICHVHEKAAEKSYSELGRIRKIQDKRRAEGSNHIIVIAGCLGQAEGEEIFKRTNCVCRYCYWSSKLFYSSRPCSKNRAGREASD